MRRPILGASESAIGDWAEKSADIGPFWGMSAPVQGEGTHPLQTEGQGKSCNRLWGNL